MQNIKHYISILSNKLKIRDKLFLSLVTKILFLSIVTYAIATHFTSQITDQFIYQYIQTEHKLVTDNISMYLDELITLSLRYKTNSDFYAIMNETDTSKEEKQDKLLLAASQAQLNHTEMITNIYLFTPDETVYLLNGQKELPLPTKELLDSDSSNPYYYVGTPISDTEENWYIPISMKFYNYNTFHEIGYLIFYLPQNAVTKLFYEIFCDSETTFLTDCNGTILFHNTMGEIGKNISSYDITLSDSDFYVENVTLNEQSCVAVSSSLCSSAKRIGFSWHLFTIIPHRILNQSSRHLQFLLSFFVIVIVIFASFLSLHLSSRLTASIKALSQKLRCISADNLHSFFSPNPQDELYELEQGYNEMLLRINDLLEKNKQDQIKKRKLEFTALQAQINPHFLYNTFDTIGWIATLREQPEIEQMVLELSRFFRLSLHKGEQIISLEDELGIVSSYAKIEQLRNPGKFDIFYDISPDLLQIKVPKIILQPIVENAIKHGTSQVKHHGIITIRGYYILDDVYLEVKDNGNGFQNKPSSLHGSGYGLKNINERIQLEYGEVYGLSIDSRSGEGTTVKLHIHF